MCENENARLAMYNNYTITEDILANSSKAIEIMKNSSRYQVVNNSIDDRRNFSTLYAGKAFVFSISQSCSSKTMSAGKDTTFNCYHHGEYLNGGIGK